MELNEEQQRLHAQRMVEYGSDGVNNLRNVGLMWTGILQAEYGIILEHPIPNHIVACMMSAMKISRVAQGIYKEDNYDDAACYLTIAQKGQLGCIDEIEEINKRKGQKDGTDEVKKTV